MNIISILIFIATITCYFGAHVFLYFSTINFFSITNHPAKIIIFVIYCVLAISFFGAAALAHWSNGWFSKMIYFSASVWLGWFIYLVLISLVVWLLIIVFKMFNIDTKLIFGIITFISSLIIIGYGVWQAFHPIVTNVNVAFSNLPKAWETKTIVQLSDVHLGRINGVGFAEKIVAQVNDLQPDVIVITGDLFDGMGSNVVEFLPTLNKLTAPDGVYFVTGNHEGYLGEDKIISQLKNTNITVLDNRAIDLAGVQLVGVSYSHISTIDQLINYDPAKINILLYHEPVTLKQSRTENNQYNTYLSPNTSFATQKQLGIDLQLSGHTHAGQFFPFNLFAQKIYHGLAYGLFQDDTFHLYVTSGTGTWGPPLRIGTRSEIVVLHFNER